MSALAAEPQRPRKRQRQEHRHAFGFDVTTYFGEISQNYTFPRIVRNLANRIVSVNAEGQCIYKHPNKFWETETINGIFATFKGCSKKIFISGMHTKHTESLYKMAFKIRNALREQPSVHLIKKPSLNFRDVDISGATKQQRRNSSNVIYLGAIHDGRTVVLKTTTDPGMQLVYILDAIIHEHVSKTSPNYVAKLHFVGFAGDALIVCSDQMTSEVSIVSFMGTLKQRYRPDIAVYTMVHSFCLAIRKLQRFSNFTHRDCHTNNVYYDSRRKITKFIDFDWSCVKIGSNRVSVPRHLYDTTRPEYGTNKSVDCCVFFRTLGYSLRDCPVFKKKIYDPLMRRYEVDSREMLKRKMQTGDVAALQIFKMSTINGKADGRFAHRYGIAKHKESYDYIMGYYTYTSMTPNFILRFLQDNKFF